MKKLAGSLNRTWLALIGLVLLIGIVKKNGILLIDFALDAQRTRGLSPHDAIFEACITRFRPIIMTSLAALLGALPLMLGYGAGAELLLNGLEPVVVDQFDGGSCGNAERIALDGDELVEDLLDLRRE